MEGHMYWSDPRAGEMAKKVLAEYSGDEVRKHLEYLSALTRLAGTEDERRAAKYITDRLEEYGIATEIFEFDAYLSHPLKAELDVISPIRQSFPALAHAFIASTPPGGIEAELLALGKGTSEEDYKGVDAKGKVVLINPGVGAGQADATRIADAKEVAGQIHITPGRYRSINFMQLREPWGPPTPDTMDRLPKTPAISICDEDGKYLSELAKKEKVMVRYAAEASRGYKRVRYPMGILKGAQEPEKYVLCGAHYCGWFLGATDNAAANSILLEMARIFARQRKELARGIKFAWWAGHSQGSFAGSTWFVDNYWEDLRDNAVAYLHMDGLGRIGADTWEMKSSPELRKFSESLVKETLGLTVESKMPALKGGDQSFWGMGLPFFAGRNNFTAERKAALAGRPEWYAHTAEDTLDKVDMALLEDAFRVYATSSANLCAVPILPFNFTETLGIFKRAMDDLQKDGVPAIDLTPLSSHLDNLEKNVRALHEVLEKQSDSGSKSTEKAAVNKYRVINQGLIDLTRILLPALYSKVGKYGNDDFATKLSPLPALQPLAKMNAADRESETYKALCTALLRERNKLADALHMANRVLDDVLK